MTLFWLRTGGGVKMVLEWPVLPLLTPHICSSWGIAIISIKTTSDFRLGPRYASTAPLHLPGGQSLALGDPQVFSFI